MGRNRLVKEFIVNDLFARIDHDTNHSITTRELVAFLRDDPDDVDDDDLGRQRPRAKSVDARVRHTVQEVGPDLDARVQEVVERHGDGEALTLAQFKDVVFKATQG